MSSVNRTAGAAGTVTLTIRNTAGQLLTPVSTPVVQWYTDAGRTAGVAALTVTGTGSVYTAAYTAAQAPAGVATRYLKVTIEVSTGVFDVDADDDIGFVDAATVLGNAYVTVAELRALPNLADTAKFTDAELSAATDWFEAVFEDYTQVAWVPRTVVGERHDGWGYEILLDHQQVRTITAVNVYSDGTLFTSYTAAELADVRLSSTGMIRRVSMGSFTSGYGNITVDYTHGYDAPPADIVEAAKVAIRDRLLNDNTGNRVFAIQSEQGIVRQSTPGPGRPFGIPDVDATANRRSRATPGIA